MISITELSNMAAEKLADAESLCESGRFNGAIYLCGYALELALKRRICETLDWNGFPDSAKEFDNYRSFRTHDLNVLLHLTGQENFIKKEPPEGHLADWNMVERWNAEDRYKIGNSTREDADGFIRSSKKLLRVL